MDKKTKKGGGAKKPKPPKIRTSEEAMLDVKHEFTTKERDDIAREMAAKMTTKAQLEETLKSISADYKAKIKLIDAEINDRHNKFTVGYEFRPTAVIVHFSKANDAKGKPVKKKGWKRIVRKDSGEWIRDEEMTHSDMQVELMDRQRIEEESKRAKDAEKKKKEEAAAPKADGEQPLNSPQVPDKAGESASTAAKS